MDLELQKAQTEWALSEATESLVGGSAGGGKSYFMRVASIMFAMDISGIQIYIFRRTFPDLIANHINNPMGLPVMLAEFINSGHVKYNTSKNEFVFWNGSRIVLAHCQHEKDMYKYQGAEFHCLFIDELTHFTDKIYRFLRSRVRMSGVEIPERYILKDGRKLFPRIINSSNPGGVGHNWVKSTFIDVAPPKTVIKMPKEEGGLYRAYYPATINDNPKLLEDDPDYRERLSGLGSPDLVRAMLNGDWDIVAGGAIDDIWQRDKHVIKPFSIPKSWYIDRTYDWGSAKPACSLWWAESDGTPALIDGEERHFPRGTVFMIYEIYFFNGRPNEGSRMLATEHADMIKEIDDELSNAGYKPNAGSADNAIFSKENGRSIAEDMASRGVYWTESNKSAGSRIQGLEKLREMLKNVLTSPNELAGLYVFDRCTHTIRTLPVLPRDERNPDDIDTKAEDHIYDAVRYRLLKKQYGTISGGYNVSRAS